MPQRWATDLCSTAMEQAARTRAALCPAVQLVRARVPPGPPQDRSGHAQLLQSSGGGAAGGCAGICVPVAEAVGLRPPWRRARSCTSAITLDEAVLDLDICEGQGPEEAVAECCTKHIPEDASCCQRAHHAGISLPTLAEL